MKLEIPSLKHETAYRKMMDDYASVGEVRYEEFRFKEFDFQKYIEQLQDEAAGLNLKPNYVPAHTFWLISDEGELLGVSRLRTKLNEALLNRGGHIGYDITPSKRGQGVGTELLRMTLLEAKKQGIYKVMISCDSENLGSYRIIEKNGGILEDERIDNTNGRKYKRYWINL